MKLFDIQWKNQRNHKILNWYVKVISNDCLSYSILSTVKNMFDGIEFDK